MSTSNAPATLPAKPSRGGKQKRNAALRALDLKFIEEKIVAGHTHEEIAGLLAKERQYTLTRSQISYDLKRLKKLWIDAATASFAEQQARALRELDAVLVKAWELHRRKPDDTAGLQLVLAAHDRRVKLLGLASANKVELSGPAGGPVKMEATAIPAGPIDDAQKMEILKRHLARLELEAVAAKEPLAITPAA